MRKSMYRGISVGLILCMTLLSACGKNTSSDTEAVINAGAAEENTQEMTGASEVSESASEASTEDAAKDAANESLYNGLFNTSYVHTVDIEISDDDWSDLLANPLNKTKYHVNVTIDGETIEDVSFATKGNTSLSSVASDKDSDRYSFKINFGKYVDDQTYYGLDKLNLNNIYADATYLKDYLSYQLFNYMGVDASLTSYVSLTVNGKAQGLYLAIEDVSDSFLARTDNSDGALYKPETASLDNAGMKDGQAPEGFNPQDGQGGQQGGGFTPPDGQAPEGFNPQDGQGGQQGGGFTPPDGQAPEGFNPQDGQGGQQGEGFTPPDGQMPDGFNPQDGQNGDNAQGNGNRPQGFGGKGGFGGDDAGASLKYKDDEISSYSDIFDNAETDVMEEDEKRLIASLKKLSEGNAEESVDIDDVINYFTVHNFVMNYDSYTGNMLHNYFLYEEDGKLKMIPWDYNLSFGAFSNGGGRGGDGNNWGGRGGQNNTNDTNNTTDDKAFDRGSEQNGGMGGTKDATEIVNYGIDSPLSGATEADRPMWSWITSNDEYLNKYHESFTKLVSYVNSEEFQNELARLYEMLLPYVEKDATAFYTADEFTKAFNTLKDFISLRAESIEKQLSGKLSTVTDKQEASDRVDASNINIGDMGSQGRGR